VIPFPVTNVMKIEKEKILKKEFNALFIQIASKQPKVLFF